MFHGKEIENKTNVKYLGCLLDNDLSGKSMAHATITKINGCLKFLYRNASFLDQATRKTLCNALIRSHQDYACTSWFSGLSKDLKKKVQIV